VVRARRATLGVCACAVVAGCKPDLDQTVSIVKGPQILAVRSDPAEATPMTPVTYTALYVDPTEAVASPPLEWAFCNARKPLAELGPVSPQCLQKSGDWFVPLGAGGQVVGALPDIACRQFGPDVPEPQPGQPQGRPVDPDTTGGYYQPVRVFAPAASGAVVGIGETRLSCGLAGATSDQAAQYAGRYRNNTNPAVDSLAILGGSGATLQPDGQGVANSITAGQRVAFRVTWADCPAVDVCGDSYCGPDETSMTCMADCAMPKGCTGAERYVLYDLMSRSLVDEREGIHVSWFATDGTFDVDRTGRDPEHPTPSSDDGWLAPARATTVHMWIVLLDDRGGTGWASYTLSVR